MTAMTVALLVTAALAVSVLIGLIVLVSIASRGEDAEWTLSGPPSGRIQATARRALGFYAEQSWHHRGDARAIGGLCATMCEFIQTGPHMSAVLNGLTRTSDAPWLN